MKNTTRNTAFRELTRVMLLARKVRKQRKQAKAILRRGKDIDALV